MNEPNETQSVNCRLGRGTLVHRAVKSATGDNYAPLCNRNSKSERMVTGDDVTCSRCNQLTNKT